MILRFLSATKRLTPTHQMIGLIEPPVWRGVGQIWKWILDFQNRDPHVVQRKGTKTKHPSSDFRLTRDQIMRSLCIIRARPVDYRLNLERGRAGDGINRGVKSVSSELCLPSVSTNRKVTGLDIWKALTTVTLEPYNPKDSVIKNTFTFSKGFVSCTNSIFSYYQIFHPSLLALSILKLWLGKWTWTEIRRDFHGFSPRVHVFHIRARFSLQMTTSSCNLFLNKQLWN